MSGAIRRKRKSNFTQVSNEMIEDERLSYKAKGIFMYLYSKSELKDWTYNMKDIVNQSKEGKDGVLSGIKELEKYMYVERIPCRSKGAKFSGYDYVIDDTPSLGEESQGGLSATANPQSHGGLSVTANPPLSNTDSTNTDYNVADKSDDDIPKAFTETMLDALEVAQYLSAKLSESIDNYKQPSIAGLHKWAKDIDLAIRLDNRTKAQLIDAINWIHYEAGSFWIGNVKSGKKLRAQFDTLTAQRAPAKEKVNIRTKALQAFGVGKPFFSFKDTQNDNRSVKVCIYGDYNALYDYNRSEYIAKDQANKVWDHIEKNFDAILAKFKEGQL